MSKEMFYEMQVEELSKFVTDVEEGNLNALRAYAEIKRLESYVSHAKRQIEPLAFEEADKYPEKSFEAEGFNFEKRNGGISYNYKGIPEWMEIENKKKALEKQAQTTWKLYQQTGRRPITDDGEELPLPEITPRKDSLVVK
jgi:hypothetical protein